MKLNIDLTENQDFLQNNQERSTPFNGILFPPFLMSTLSYSKSFGKYISKYILDIPYCINQDIEKRQSGGIIQGDRERRFYIETTSTKADYYCERCGRNKKYPWENFSALLCPKCTKALESEANSIPWRR